MCESLRPGMMVRRCPSITRVCGPRRRKISSSLPTAVIVPAVMAIASTNEGTPFVAILALCNMISADTAVSVSTFSKWIEKGGGGSARRVLLVNSNCSGNLVLREFRGRRAMYHRVHVLDADPVGTVVVLHDVHHRSAGLCPKAGDENFLAPAFFDRRDKVFVVPRVHGRTLDGFLPREYGSQLRPHISAKGLRLDRCQNHGHIENPCGLSECHGVVDNSLTVEIACSKQNLALMVDQRHDE